MGHILNGFENFKGLVVFYLNDKLFCTDIDDVLAIVNPADFPKNVKNSFLIKMNLDVEGHSIPIIELHNFFGLKNGKITPISRFICMEKSGFTFAFTADKVEEMITLDTNTKNNFEFVKTEGEKYLTGKVKYLDTVFNLPNFEKIINELFIHHKLFKEGYMNWNSEHPP